MFVCVCVQLERLAAEVARDTQASVDQQWREYLRDRDDEEGGEEDKEEIG